MTLDLKPAFEIALSVHGEQKDRGGEPYMWHVCRVAMAGQTPEEQVVGLLHDVLEDARYGWGRWDKLTDDIIDSYGWHIYFAVKALTRMPDMTYQGYLRHVSENPLAVKVKLADLMDNMRADRLLKLPPEDRVRLLKKYQRAYAFLSGVPFPVYQRADGTYHTDEAEFEAEKAWHKQQGIDLK